MVFRDELLPLSVFSQFLHVVAHIGTSFLLLPVIPLCEYTTSLHPFTGHCIFFLFHMMNNAATNIHVQVFVWTRVFDSLGVHTCEWNYWMFNFLRNFQAVFRSGCTLLHFYQQRITFLFLLSSPMLVIICLFYFNHSSKLKVVYCWGLDLHFPDD